jgi:hypothetical protein
VAGLECQVVWLSQFGMQVIMAAVTAEIGIHSARQLMESLFIILSWQRSCTCTPINSIAQVLLDAKQSDE